MTGGEEQLNLESRTMSRLKHLVLPMKRQQRREPKRDDDHDDTADDTSWSLASLTIALERDEIVVEISAR